MRPPGRPVLYLSRVFARRGDAARDSKHWATAERSYLAALQLAPARVDLWVQAAHAAKEQRKYDRALGFYERAARHTPDNGDIHFHRGQVLLAFDRREDAVLAFRQAAGSRSGHRPALEALQKLGASIPEASGGRGGVAAEDELAVFVPSKIEVRPGARLFCDVSGVLVLPASPAVRWWTDFALKLQEDGLVQLIAAPESSGPLLEVSTPAARDGSNFWRFGSPVGRAPRGVILCPVLGGEASHQFLAAWKSSAPDHPLIVILRSADQVIGQYERAEPATLDLLAHASKVVIDDRIGADALRAWLTDLFPNRTPTIDLAINVVGETKSLGAAAGAEADVSTGRRLVLPAPHNANELQTIVAAAEMPPMTRITALVSPDTPEGIKRQLTSSKAVDVSSSVVLKVGDVLVLPASAPGGKAWLHAALKAGRPVLASARGGGLGSGVLAQVQFIDTFDLNAAYRALRRPLPAGVSPARTDGFEAFSAAVRCGSLVKNLKPVPVPSLKPGRFIFLGESEGPGRRLASVIIAKPSLETMTSVGMPILSSVKLRFGLMARPDAPQTIRFLLKADHPGHAYAISLRAPHGVETGSGVLSAKMTWATITAVGPKEPSQPLEVDIVVSGGGDGAPSPVLVGFIVYPVDQDRLWFEFLEDALCGNVRGVDQLLATA